MVMETTFCDFYIAERILGAILSNWFCIYDDMIFLRAPGREWLRISQISPHLK